MALEYYTNYLNNIAQPPKEYWKEGAQQFIDYAFTNTSNVHTIQEEVTFGEKDFANIDVRINHLIKGHLSTRNSEDYKKVIFSDNEKVCGSGYKFIFSGFTWLTVSYDKLKYETNAAGVRRCNHDLKWYNDEGKLITEPCVVDYYKFSKTAGVNENKEMILPDNQRLIILQMNDDTNELDYSKRFIFNRMAWKVIDYDRVNEEGILLLTVIKDFRDKSKDDMVNEIAINDYPLPVYTLDILNSSVELSATTTFQLETEVKIDGVISTTEQIVYTSSDESIATVDDDGIITGVLNGIITVYAKLANNEAVIDSIGVEITTVPDSNILEEIVGNNKIPVGLYEIYEIYKYIDSSVQVDIYTFSISNDSALMSNVTGNTIYITALNKDNSTVILTATNNSTLDVFNKTIDLTSLW